MIEKIKKELKILLKGFGIVCLIFLSVGLVVYMCYRYSLIFVMIGIIFLSYLTGIAFKK